MSDETSLNFVAYDVRAAVISYYALRRCRFSNRNNAIKGQGMIIKINRAMPSKDSVDLPGHTCVKTLSLYTDNNVLRDWHSEENYVREYKPPPPLSHQSLRPKGFSRSISLSKT